MPKVIVVAPQDVYTYLHDLYHNPTVEGGWELQDQVDTVKEMMERLMNGTLTNEVDIVIFNDSSMIYGEEDEYSQLVSTVATFAPHALVMTLFYDFDSNQARLHDDVARYASSEGMELHRFYDVNTQEPDMNEEFGRVLNEYATEPRILDNPYENAQAATSEPIPEPISHSEAPAFVQREESFHEQEPKKGKILISTSSKGGSGKTTVALCTATTLYYASLKAAEAGLREKPLNIVLVDLDIRDGQIGLNIGVTIPTALNILVDEANDGNPSKEVIEKYLVDVPNLGIHTLLAPKRPRTAAHLQPNFYKHVIERLQEMFDVVVIDTSVNYLDKLLGEVALPMADNIMFVADFSMGAVFGMTRWIDEVTSPVSQNGSGVDIDRIGIVMNKSARNLGIDQSLLQEAAMNADIVCSIPLDSQSMIAATNYKRLHDIVQRHETISPAYFTIVKYFFPDEELLSPLIEDGQGAEPAKKPKRQALDNLKEEAKPKKRLFGR